MSYYCFVWDTRPEPTAPPYARADQLYACADTFYRGLLDDFLATYNGTAASLLQLAVKAKFAAHYGAGWERYLELWIAFWGIIETSIPGLEPAVDLYTAPSLWMERLHYLRCNGSLARARCLCRLAG